MHPVAWATAALAVLAQARVLNNCAEYCSYLQFVGRAILWRPECTCGLEDQRYYKPDINLPIPVLDESAIYYAPTSVLSAPSVSFSENPFHIVNPAFKRRFQKYEQKEKQQVNKNIKNRLVKSIRSVSGINHESSNIQQEIDKGLEEVPLYLDIDIHKVYNNQRSSEKSEVDDFMLSEKDLIECIDLHIIVFSRNSDMDNDLIGIWDEKKLQKYNSWSDSDLVIEIQNKCHLPADIMKKSVLEITTARPKKKSTVNNAHENYHRKENIEHIDYRHVNVVVEDLERVTTLPFDVSSKYTTETIQASSVRENKYYDIKSTQEKASSTSHSTDSDQIVHPFYLTTIAEVEGTTFLPNSEHIETVSTRRSSSPTTSTNDKYSTINQISTSHSKVDLIPAITHRDPLNRLAEEITIDPTDVELTSIRSYPTSWTTNSIFSEYQRNEGFDSSTKNPVFTTQSYILSGYSKNNSNNDTITTTQKKTEQSISPAITISSLASSEFYTTTNAPYLTTTVDKITSSLDSSPSESITHDRNLTRNPSKSDHIENKQSDKDLFDEEKNHLTNTLWTTMSNSPHQFNSTPDLTSYTEIVEMNPSKNINFDPNDTNRDLSFDNTNQNVEQNEFISMTELVEVDNKSTTEYSEFLINDTKLGREISSPQHQFDVADTKQSLSKSSFTVLPIDLYTPEGGNEMDHTTISQYFEVLEKKSSKRLDYPEREIKIPKIVSKELYNDTVFTEVKGYETIPNNDFMPDYDNNITMDSASTVSSEETTVSTDFQFLTDRNTEAINKSDTPNKEGLTTSSTNIQDIVGKLYFLFGDKQIPARFVQESDGRINLGIDGRQLCDKLIKSHENYSTMLVALCKCSQSGQCTKEIIEKS